MSRAKLKQSNTKGKQSWTEQNLEREREIRFLWLRLQLQLEPSSLNQILFLLQCPFLLCFSRKFPLLPSFLPSFFCFSAVTERERERLVCSTVLIIQSAATHLGILLIDWYWCVLFVSHSIFFLWIQIQTKLKIKPFLSLFLLNIFYWVKEWINK